MARQERSAAVFVERFFQFSLLGLVASGYLAVAGSGYLDSATVVLTAAGLLLRGLMVCGLVRLEISDRATAWAALGYTGFFLLDYWFLSRTFLSATVHLVFFLAVIKILASKTVRDDLYTAAIAFMELLTAAILSVNFNFFLFQALFLLCAIAALTSGEIRRSMRKSTATARGRLKGFHPRLGLLSASITAGILVLTAGLFFLLPRTADAALSRFMSHRLLIPGFSNHVTLGEVGEIQTSSQPVMHVQVYSPELIGALKWRGGALTAFDGKRWWDPDPRRQRIPVERGHVDLDSPGQPGRHINYDVQLEPQSSNVLFFAGHPERVDLRSATLLHVGTATYQLEHTPPEAFRYAAYSLLEDPPETSVIYPPPVLPLAERERSLERPALDPRIPELARSMTAGTFTDLERVRAIERRLRSDYGYTLETPDREPADPLSDFLFTRKKGYCEYFASTMAVMLRTLSIPARLVTGFQSGVYNPITDLWLVRASDAHTWVEAWIPGRGWATFDPTPPDRNSHAFSLFSRLGLYLDAAQTFWQDWVVSYDMGRQGTLADRMEQGTRRMGIRWFDTVSALHSGWNVYVVAPFRRYFPGAAAALGLAVLLWLGSPPLLRLLRVRLRVRRARRGEASVGDATLLYQGMLRALRQRGYQKPAWFTPVEFARSLPKTPLGAAVTEFTDEYNALRFGGRTEVAPHLWALLDDLQRRGRKW